MYGRLTSTAPPDSRLRSTPSTSTPGSKTFRRCLTALIVVSLVSVAASCSNESSAIETSVDAGAESEPVSSFGIEDPSENEKAAIDAWNAFFSLMPYGDSGNTIETAIIQAKRQECMTERGFEYRQYPYVANGYQGPPSMIVPLPPVEQVSTMGYRAYPLIYPYEPDGGANAAWEDAERFNQQQAQDNSGWQDALMGQTDGGPSCIVEAETFLDDRAPRRAKDIWHTLTAGEVPPTASPGFHGQEMDASRAAWSSCMETAGYTYNDPSEPQDEFQSNRTGDEVSDEEISIAVADTECRSSSGFRDALVVAVAATFQEWLAQHEGTIIEQREAIPNDIANMTELANQLGVG